MLGIPAIAPLVMLLLVSPAAPSAAAGFIATVIDPDGPPHIWGKGVGDLDGDGKDDLLVGARYGGLYWYQNPGWTKQTISATTRIEEDMEVVDFDGDGRNDVVAVTYLGLTLFHNGSSGWTETPLISGTNFHDVEVIDLDGDGKLDLAARNQGGTGNLLYLWRRLSIATWVPTVKPIPITGEGLASADIDRDGRKDLVIGEYWYRNISMIGRVAVWRYLYHRDAPRDAYIATGDINGDGRVDIVASPAEPNDRFHPVLWLEAPPDPITGTWVSHVIEPLVEKVTHFVGVLDFDRDGDLDVASALTHLADRPQIKVHENVDGAGTFDPPRVIAELSSHSMKLVSVGSDAGQSLFGADYADSVRTPVRLLRWTPD